MADNLPPSSANVTESGSLNLTDPSGPHRPVMGLRKGMEPRPLGLAARRLASIPTESYEDFSHSRGSAESFRGSNRWFAVISGVTV
jgi:hypothetical protein